MKKHSVDLDILRGIAALAVVFYHLNLLGNIFDKNFSIEIIQYRFPGHLCVLVFFILSGYVIGRNTEKLSNKTLIKSYVKKRLVRLVPIYFVALLFTIFITWGKYRFEVILSNLFFVSVPLDNVTKENGPLWSLQYEILYYFVFIIFSFFDLDLFKSVKIIFTIVMLLFLLSLKMTIHPLVISVFIGFLFWITGAMLANQKNSQTWNISNSRILSIFILIFCLQYFNPYGPIIKILKIHLPDYTRYSEFQQMITYFDLYFFPLAILLILSLTHYYMKHYKWLLLFLYGFSFLIMVMIPLSYSWQYFMEKQYIIPAVILLSSILLWILNARFGEKIKNRMKSISSLSNISYAIYIVHSPLIYLWSNIHTNSWTLFILKLTAFFAILFLVSYLLEMKFQPLVKQFFYKK